MSSLKFLKSILREKQFSHVSFLAVRIWIRVFEEKEALAGGRGLVSKTLTAARQTVSCYQLVPLAWKISDWSVLNVTDRSSFHLLFPNIFCGLFSRGTCDIYFLWMYEVFHLVWQVAVLPKCSFSIQSASVITDFALTTTKKIRIFILECTLFSKTHHFRNTVFFSWGPDVYLICYLEILTSLISDSLNNLFFF